MTARWRLGARVAGGSVLVALGLACTGGAASSAEVPPPVPSAAVPSAEAPAPAGGAKAGKHGKRGRGGSRPDAAGCPEGVVAAPSWPGEWPSPVVDVVKPVTVQVRAEPCSRPSFDCEVPVGIYHPWSHGEGEYVTVRAIVRYEVLQDTDTDELHVKKGDTVEVFQYFGEGYCGYRVAGREITASCPDMLGEAMKKLDGREMPDKQLFSVSCGAKTGWVEASDALLALPEVRPGTTPEYGEVGPGTE